MEGKEQFKPYLFDQRIQVGNLGTIIGVTGRILKGCVYRGYRFIGRVENKKILTEKVAKLVAVTWVHNSNPFQLDTINHINGNKSDDRASNLEWCTQSQNMIHASNTDLLKFGSEHYLSKLDEFQVKVIKSGLFNNLRDVDIARYFNVHRATIKNIHKGVSWKRVTPDARWS